MKQLLLTILTVSLISGITKAQTTPPNGGFETWQNRTLIFNPLVPIEVPTSWSTFDSLANILNFTIGQSTAIQKTVTRNTSIKNSGTASAMLTTKTFPGLNVAIPAMLTNAVITLDAAAEEVSFTGGTAITQRVSKAAAFIRYAPATKDTASFTVEIINRTFGKDSLIGFGSVEFGARPTFTKIEVPIDYYHTTLPANLIRYYFTNSNDTVQNSSTLYVDDVTYTTTTGVTEALMNDIEITAYPNPANDVLSINASSDDELAFELYAIDGKVLQTKTFSKTTQIRVADLANGLYVYNIKDKDQVIIKKASITISR
jgi:hypothetical protein